MKYDKITAIATCFIAFSTFLGVLAAIVYYLYQIKNTNMLEVFIWATIYIDTNLLFLYYGQFRDLYDRSSKLDR